jgi:nitroimidazol reductase NimA-like FMN-containing flavoprotein (pyridoxamine 5'-phosphate oxidase superfamily)
MGKVIVDDTMSLNGFITASRCGRMNRWVMAASATYGCSAVMGVPVTTDRCASEPDPAAIARKIIDSNRYLILATADRPGRPWASPVWYAHEDYTSFLWVSRPSARHSRNIAARATVSAVIFDSTVAEDRAEAVYLEALAGELTGAQRDRAIEIFSRRSQALGLSGWNPANVTAPAPHRLYQASASARFILAPGDQRLPVPPVEGTGKPGSPAW